MPVDTELGYASANDGFLRVTPEDGTRHRIIFADVGACLLLGVYESAELIGTILQSWAPISQRTRMCKLLAAACTDEGDGTLSTELHGHEIQLHVSVVAMRPVLVLAILLVPIVQSEGSPCASAGGRPTSLHELSLSGLGSYSGLSIANPARKGRRDAESEVHPDVTMDEMPQELNSPLALVKCIEISHVGRPPRYPGTFELQVKIALADFFSGSEEDQLVMEASESIVLKSGSHMKESGLRSRDRITHIDGRAVRNSAHFRSLICTMMDVCPCPDSASDSQERRHVVVTFRRRQITGATRSFSRSLSSLASEVEGSKDASLSVPSGAERSDIGSGLTWHSMASVTLKFPNLSGMPGRALHQAKVQEFASHMEVLRDTTVRSKSFIHEEDAIQSPGPEMLISDAIHRPRSVPCRSVREHYGDDDDGAVWHL